MIPVRPWTLQCLVAFLAMTMSHDPGNLEHGGALVVLAAPAGERPTALE